MTRIAIIIGLITIIFSCERKLELQFTKTSEVYEQVFSIADSTPIINIDFSKSRYDAFEHIDSQFNYNICHQLTSFAHTLSTGDKIKLHIIKECPIDRINGVAYFFPNYFKININANGNLLVENSILQSISELSSVIDKNFPWEYADYHQMELKWQINTPIDSMEKVFQQIKNGYLKIYQKKSQQLYKESFYKISMSERDSILKQLPYCILLDIGSYGYPGPPPPPPPHSS